MPSQLSTSLGTMRIHLVGYTTTQALLWDDVNVVGEMPCATGGARMSYYPYGQEMGTVTENDTAKFGTYTRDAVTGLDYAMNRYYQSTWGRFTSPDPYRASGGPGDPGSWVLTWAVASYFPRGDLAMGRRSPYDVRDGHR